MNKKALFRDGCVIPDPSTNTMTMTGGYWSDTTVSQYGQEGWREDLPSLNVGRYYHACAAYYKDDGTRVSYFSPETRFSFITLLHNAHHPKCKVVLGDVHYFNKKGKFAGNRIYSNNFTEVSHHIGNEANWLNMTQNFHFI